MWLYVHKFHISLLTEWTYLYGQWLETFVSSDVQMWLLEW